MKKHAQKYFLAWVEDSLREDQKQEISDHLKLCAQCREYYRRMTEFFEKPDVAGLPTLAPDPYLPTRIRAGEVEANVRETVSHPVWWFRWSLASLMVLVALMFGIYLGSSVHRSGVASEVELASQYYQAYSEDEAMYQWESIFDLQNGDER